MDKEDNINSIGDILGSTFKNGAEYSNTTKTAIFFSFWNDIVGKKFMENTKPYSYNLGKLYVSCKNSFVLQEISLYKKDIIKKANVYSKAVEMNIDDIVFGYKNWNSLTKSDNNLEIEEEFSQKIDFNKYTLAKDECLKIKNAVDKINFLNEEQKEKFINNIKNNLIKENLKK